MEELVCVFDEVIRQAGSLPLITLVAWQSGRYRYRMDKSGGIINGSRPGIVEGRRYHANLLTLKIKYAGLAFNPFRLVRLFSIE